MLKASVTNWTIGLLLAAVVAAGGVGFYVGRLSARISAVERLVEGHYTTITRKVASLEENVEKMDHNITGLRREVIALTQEIRKSLPKEGKCSTTSRGK